MKMQKHVLLLRIGMLSLLAFFAVSYWFLRPHSTVHRDLIDGFAGWLLGISIGCNLWSLALKRKACA